MAERNQKLWMSKELYNQLKLIADLEGVECPEILAESWLNERIKKDHPDIQKPLTKASEAYKRVLEEYRDEMSKV